MSSEAPYDPYIPAGGSGAAGGASAQQNGNQRTAALQAVSFLLLSSVEGLLDGIRGVQALPFPYMDVARCHVDRSSPERGGLDRHLWQHGKLT